jgi:hypothetical protein
VPAGVASGIAGTPRPVGGVLGAAVLGAILSSSLRRCTLLLLEGRDREVQVIAKK